MFFEKKTEEDNDYPDDKHEDRDPVDTMHNADVTIGRRIRIFLFNIEIFSYLPEHSHREVCKQRYLTMAHSGLFGMYIFAALFGGLAHLVERKHGMFEVIGSSPISSTGRS